MKKIISLFLVFTMLLSLSACSSKEKWTNYYCRIAVENTEIVNKHFSDDAGKMEIDFENNMLTAEIDGKKYTADIELDEDDDINITFREDVYYGSICLEDEATIYDYSEDEEYLTLNFLFYGKVPSIYGGHKGNIYVSLGWKK